MIVCIKIVYDIVYSAWLLGAISMSVLWTFGWLQLCWQSESVLTVGSSSAVAKLCVDKNPSGLITKAAAGIITCACVHMHACPGTHLQTQTCTCTLYICPQWPTGSDAILNCAWLQMFTRWLLATCGSVALHNPGRNVVLIEALTELTQSNFLLVLFRDQFLQDL